VNTIINEEWLQQYMASDTGSVWIGIEISISFRKKRENNSVIGHMDGPKRKTRGLVRAIGVPREGRKWLGRRGRRERRGI
jgi:hypothetical protein